MGLCDVFLLALPLVKQQPHLGKPPLPISSNLKISTQRDFRKKQGRGEHWGVSTQMVGGHGVLPAGFSGDALTPHREKGSHQRCHEL